MTREQLAYVDRANQRLQEPLELEDRIKILRTLSQMYAAEANQLEQQFFEFVT